MRKNQSLLMGLGVVLALSTMIAGCKREPSCKLLYKRFHDCKKIPLTEQAYVAMCNKLKGEKLTREEIKCSAKSKCSEFKKCIDLAEKKARVQSMKKRWKQASAKAEKGEFNRAMSFCDNWKG